MLALILIYVLGFICAFSLICNRIRQTSNPDEEFSGSVIVIAFGSLFSWLTVAIILLHSFIKNNY